MLTGAFSSLLIGGLAGFPDTGVSYRKSCMLFTCECAHVNGPLCDKQNMHESCMDM